MVHVYLQANLNLIYYINYHPVPHYVWPSSLLEYLVSMYTHVYWPHINLPQNQLRKYNLSKKQLWCRFVILELFRGLKFLQNFVKRCFEFDNTT